MSTMDRAADSGPSARDYKAEIGELLAQADSLRAEADSIDLAAEAAASLGMATVHSAAAQQTADRNAARASEKVSADARAMARAPHSYAGAVATETIKPAPARRSTTSRSGSRQE